jgi:hypothetical protein
VAGLAKTLERHGLKRSEEAIKDMDFDLAVPVTGVPSFIHRYVRWFEYCGTVIGGVVLDTLMERALDTWREGRRALDELIEQRYVHPSHGRYMHPVLTLSSTRVTLRLGRFLAFDTDHSASLDLSEFTNLVCLLCNSNPIRS